MNNNLIVGGGGDGGANDDNDGTLTYLKTASATVCGVLEQWAYHLLCCTQRT